MKITVTQQHIDEGIRGDATKCPVALALKEQFPEGWQPTATQIYIYASNGKDECKAETTQVCRNFIINFDKHPKRDTRTNPEPFDFEVTFCQDNSSCRICDKEIWELRNPGN